MVVVDDGNPFTRRPQASKVYGRKAAVRRSMPSPSNETKATVDSSDSDEDGHDELSVIRQVGLSPTRVDKGKGKEASPAKLATGERSEAKRTSPGKRGGGGKALNTANDEDATDWDEASAFAGATADKRRPAATGRRAHVKPKELAVQKTYSSPEKRQRLSKLDKQLPDLAADGHRANAGPVTANLGHVNDPLSQNAPQSPQTTSPPPRKRRRVTPPAPVQELKASQPVNAIAANATEASASRGALYGRDTRPATPPPLSSAQNAQTRSPSPPKSPAKDLSKVFDRFHLQANSRPVQRRTTSLIASIAGKERSKPTDEQNSRHLQSDSATKSPPRPQPVSRPASPRTIGMTSSQPELGSPTRHSATLKSPLKRAATIAAPVEASSLGSRAATGSIKTYGGTRTFKRDLDEERMFGIDSASRATPAKQPTASTSGSTSSTPRSKLLLPSLPRQPQERRSYSTMRSMLGVDQEEEDEDSQGTSALKSITQLRAKGENSKFVDELDYLIDGLQPNESLSGRRATVLEILRKMLNKDFVRRLKSSGFDERVYIEFRRAEAGEGDKVLDPSLAFLVAILARDQRIAEALCRNSASTFNRDQDGLTSDGAYDEHISDVLKALGTVLRQAWAGDDIGGQPSSSNRKTDVRMLASLREIIDESAMLKESSLPVTAKSLSLVAISIISFYAPRSIFRPQHMLCTSGALQAVVLAFVGDVRALESRIDRYETGLDLLSEKSTLSLSSMDLCLRIFEASMSATPLAVSALCDSRRDVATALGHMVLGCHILALSPHDPSDSNPESRHAQTAMDGLLSALRMLIDLTTSDPAWSVALAQVDDIISTLIKLIVATRTAESTTVARFRELSSPAPGELSLKKDDDRKTKSKEEGIAQSSMREDVKFDVLCLALGVLTNLVESVDEVKTVLRTTLIDPSCKHQRRCARRCTCPERSTALHRLTALYLDPLDDSSNELNRSFVNGYSGILLGLVMLDNSANQAIVTADLRPAPDAKRQLIEAMEEFATLHEQQDKAETNLQAELRQTQQSDVDGVEDGPSASSEIAGRIRRLVVSLQH